MAFLVSSALIAGCVSISNAVHARDTLDLGLVVAAGTPLRVETFNGGIEVSPGPGSDISATVERTGEGADAQAAQADRDAIEVTLELVDGVALLRAVYTPSPDSVSGGRGAAVKVTVPGTTPLDLSTSNGPIEVQGTSGGLEARTSNGPVELSVVSGALSVKTSSGPVTVDVAEPVSIDVHTSNGGITFHGWLEPGDATLETSNGSVELHLPSDAAFTIDASTSNGKASSDFAIAGTAADSVLEGTVGAPEEAAATRIAIRTSNGPITVAGE